MDVRPGCAEDEAVLVPPSSASSDGWREEEGPNGSGRWRRSVASAASDCCGGAGGPCPCRVCRERSCDVFESRRFSVCRNAEKCTTGHLEGLDSKKALPLHTCRCCGLQEPKTHQGHGQPGLQEPRTRAANRHQRYGRTDGRTVFCPLNSVSRSSSSLVSHVPLAKYCGGTTFHISLTSSCGKRACVVTE